MTVDFDVGLGGRARQRARASSVQEQRVDVLMVDAQERPTVVLRVRHARSGQPEVLHAVVAIAAAAVVASVGTVVSERSHAGEQGVAGCENRCCGVAGGDGGSIRQGFWTALKPSSVSSGAESLSPPPQAARERPPKAAVMAVPRLPRRMLRRLSRAFSTASKVGFVDVFESSKLKSVSGRSTGLFKGWSRCVKQQTLGRVRDSFVNI